MSTSADTSRLRTLFEAGIALSSELSLDGVLESIAEAAARVTGARYAALGVIDGTGTALERFITHGVDPETHAEIGELPRGRGILGVLIRDARPVRLHDLREDPRSVGFPPGHPPMRTFLGVPILLRGVAYGNLYLTEKEGGENFDAADEELVTLLALQAAVAIENARLYESATAWSAQLESLNEIGIAMLSELDLGTLLELVAARLRGLIDARVVMIFLPAGDRLRVEAVANEGAELLGAVVSRSTSKVGRVLERRQSERVDSMYGDPEVDQETARLFAVTTGLYVPLIGRDEAIGVIAAHDKIAPDPRFSDSDLRLTEQFAARAAIAVELSRRVERDALRRFLAGQELERRRLARELHDETGQALTSILLGLKAVEDARSEERMRDATRELRELVVTTLQDVRRLAVQLRPKALDDFGLVPALERLAQSFDESTGITVQLEAQLDARLPGEIETTLYRIIQEALTNVVKHSDARNVSILLVRRDGLASVIVEDDGRGFKPSDEREGGVGLLGIRERVALLDGHLTVESSPQNGTTLAVEVPLP